MSAPIADALAAQGIDAPFEIQARVLPDALAGQDVLAKAPTGSGKTLAFGIPLIERIDPAGATPTALVLVPTRELAAQVGEVLETLAAVVGIRVATAYGGVGLHDQAKKAARSHLLVATPGRLEDLASRRMLKLDGVVMLVLDEADRMLDMGFQPQVDRIVRRLPSSRQTMFFSATLDGEVGRLARSYTSDPARHEANPGGRDGGGGRPPVHAGLTRDQGADAGRAVGARRTATRSCSCEPVAAPTACWPSCASAASRPWRCTAT